MKKNMIYTAIASVLLASILGFGSVAHADDANTGSAVNVNTQTYSDGTNNANVAVNGTLGADNTKPDSNIPEGSDKWINVTVDTATIFYNTSTDTKIIAPTYHITNNSGRPVSVKVNSFTQNDQKDISKIAALNVAMKRTDGVGTSTNLITSGSLSNVSQDSSLQLANVNGNLAKGDTAVTGNNKATFTYNGAVSQKLTTEIQPSFTMNLLFTPTSW
ncbi:hypothetical protein G6R29_06475 [Fructobacillus sp. M2-14]|uniref:WxL domain-containing protein n=1 Tax=Fructobacillus broussonetiae TaxID=2713173 RepID=A0ABS5R1D4_9LACO|nr:hypothetical protein [Fructobacillus broussonetiae]MBS9339246.1 hypothetical protein [Fructobacillus broussonetiae]